MTDHFARPNEHASPPSLVELHRLSREDYTSNASRRAQDHRNDAFLIANASEALDVERGGR
jgi:hypothetical protein